MKRGMASIITPCYNGARFISETIDSVIAQTYQDWEMLIIDDGSRDDSADIVRRYMEREPRIKLLQQENAGSAAARNNGIRHAEGQYIALLDADDLWDPAFLEKQIAFMKEKNAVCVTSGHRKIDESSKEILHPITPRKVITIKDMYRMNYIGCLTGLYNAEKHGKVYLHEELKSMRDDYAYWIDIVRLEGVAYGNPEVLASYRVTAGSTTGKKYKLIGKHYSFFRKYLGFGIIRSLYNTFLWGVSGIIKYHT